MNKTIALALIASLLILGCAGVGSIQWQLAARSPAIKAFLQAHPNTQVTVEYVTANDSVAKLALYPACQNVTPQPMYFVTFQDQRLFQYAYSNLDNDTVLCSTFPRSYAKNG